VSLVKPTVKSGSRGVQKILFCNLWTLLQVSTNFENLGQFLEFKQLKMPHSVGPQTGPRPAARGRKWPVGSSMVACHARPIGRPAGPRPSGPAQPRRRPTTRRRGWGWAATRCCQRAVVGSWGGAEQVEWRRGIGLVRGNRDTGERELGRRRRVPVLKGGSQWRGFEGARPMRGGSGEEQGGVG
jgi:hypothetical protein